MQHSINPARSALQHSALALAAAAATGIPNVITPRKPLRRVLTSLALPLVALDSGQLTPCAQAAPPVTGSARWFDASTLGLSAGAGVTTWPDGSTNAANATVPSGNATPVNPPALQTIFEKLKKILAPPPPALFKSLIVCRKRHTHLPGSVALLPAPQGSGLRRWQTGRSGVRRQ